MKHIRLFLLLIIMILPSLAHAADPTTDGQYSFTGNPSQVLYSNDLQDLSFKYLSDIFGTVDGVLHGTGSQIMGKMFGIFNSAILMLGFCVLTYILMVSTLNTAHEGEILGREWSSIWIPLRTVASVSLLVPKASGYSFIQIFVMWVVVQGIVAADAVGGVAIKYILQGGNLVQSSAPPNQAAVGFAGDILKNEICMYGAYNALQQNTTLPGPVPLFIPTPSTGSQSQIFFPALGTKVGATDMGGMCGSVSPLSNMTDNSNNNLNWGQVAQIRYAAVNQVIIGLQPLAQQAANAMVPSQTNVGGNVTLDTVLNASVNQLIFAAADYKGIMAPVFAQRSSIERQAAEGLILTTAKQGWVMLGSVYFALAQLNNATNTGNDSSPPTVSFATVSDSDARWALVPSSYRNLFFCNAQTCPSTSITPNHTAQASSGSSNYIDKYVGSEYTASTGNLPFNNSIGDWYNGGQSSDGIGGKILTTVLGPIWGIFSNFGLLLDAEKQNTDPIIAISGMGSSIITLVTSLWLNTAVLIFGITLAATAVPLIYAPGFAILSFLAWFVPLFSVMLTALFTMGSIMAFYVPLIPFILFTFGAIGWFAAVIETMIAAPLVALGMAVPEGHQVFGKSTPAIMLITNVFLRPTLMVFGFFAGGILSHVGLWILNTGFAKTFGWAMAYNAGNLSNIWGGLSGLLVGILLALVAGLVIYITLVLSIINQTFGLIHQLPDKLLRWLGGGMEQLGASGTEALHEAKGAGGLSSVGDGLSKASASMTSNLKSKAKKGGGTEGQSGITDDGGSGGGASGGASGLGG